MKLSKLLIIIGLNPCPNNFLCVVIKMKKTPIDLELTKAVSVIPFETIDAQLDSPRAQVNSGVFVAPLAKSTTKDFATVQIEPETVHGPFLLESGCMLGRVFTAPTKGFRIKVEGEEFQELSSSKKNVE